MAFFDEGALVPQLSAVRPFRCHDGADVSVLLHSLRIEHEPFHRGGGILPEPDFKRKRGSSEPLFTGRRGRDAPAGGSGATVTTSI